MKLIECPRDAMQGIKDFIPTELKVEYLQALLDVGFDTLDFGSFVSPKAVPQMQDTTGVLDQLDLENSRTKLLAIVPNLKGVTEALQHGKVDFLGYPLSISETFQQRNLRNTIARSMDVLRQIISLTQTKGKEVVVYLSMGFGNPYGDPYSHEIVKAFVDELRGMGLSIISLADTVGSATGEQVKTLYGAIASDFPDLEIGLHLHVNPKNKDEIVQAVSDSGCQRIDVALGGYGGCPFAKEELTGNLPTESMVSFVEQEIDMEAFKKAQEISKSIFQRYH